MSTAAAATAAPEAGKKRSPILFILIGVIVLAAAGGGGWFWMHKQEAAKAAEAAADGDDAEEAHAKDPKHPPVFHPLDTFTVNLADRERYLQIGVVYELKSPEIAEALKTVNPIVRSRILLVLSSKTVEELSSTEGKQALAEQLIAEARGALTAKEAKGVQQVHFSSFVIQ